MMQILINLLDNTLTCAELFNGENKVAELVIDYTGTDYATWTKWVGFKMPDGTDGVHNLGTTASVTYTLTSAELKKGYLRILPFAKDLTDATIEKHFEMQQVPITDWKLGTLDNSSVEDNLIDYFDAKIAVKSVTTNTLAAGEDADVTITPNSDGYDYIFDIPQGLDGATGATGPQGPTGLTGAGAIPDIDFQGTGFTNQNAIGISVNWTNRTVTLTGTFAAYWRTVLIPILTNGWTSAAFPDVVGNYYLTYNGSSFAWSTTPWTFDQLQIAYVQYDTHDIGLRETHGFMDWNSHKEFHETIGTYKLSGGTFSGFTLASNTVANRRPLIAQTVIADEDLQSTITALSTNSYTWRYLTGAGVRAFTVGQADILSVTGNVPNYNQFTGGNWVQTPMANNQYAAIFVVALPVTSDATSQQYRYLFVQPQQVSTNLATIQALTPASLTLGDSALLVSEFVFIGKIIIRMIGSNWELTSVEVLTGSRSVQVGSPSGNYLSSVTTDATLTGLGTLASPLGTTAGQLLASYTHSTNLEVAVTSVDYTTNIFTKTGHGLSVGDRIYPVINMNTAGIPLSYFPTGLDAKQHFVIASGFDANNFKLSLTAGGAEIDISTKATVDLTKWHFEKCATQTVTITGITPITACRVVYNGKVIGNAGNASNWIYPLFAVDTFFTPSFFQTGVQIISYPTISYGGDISHTMEVLINTTKYPTLITKGISLLNNTNTAMLSYFTNQIQNIDDLTKCVGTFTSIKALHTANYYSNGTTIEVYSV